MGLEGTENLTDPYGDRGVQDDQQKSEETTASDRPTDEERMAAKETELARARDEHNRRTGGGEYAKPAEDA